MPRANRFLVAPLLVFMAATARAQESPLRVEERLLSLALSPDGTRAATIGMDRTAHLWDLTSGKLVRELSGKGSMAWRAAFSPDGKRLVLAMLPEGLTLFDGGTGALVKTLPVEKAVAALAFSPDGRRLALALPTGAVSLVDAETGNSERVLGKEEPGAGKSVGGVAWGPGGAWVACNDGLEVVVRDAASGAERGRARRQGSGLQGLLVVPPSRVLAGARDGLLVLDVEHPDAPAVLAVPGGATGAALSPDGKTLAVAARLDAVLLDLATGKVARQLPSNHGNVEVLGFAPDGTHVFAGCADGSLVRLEARAEGAAPAAPEPPDPVETLLPELARKAAEDLFPRIAAALDRAAEPARAPLAVSVLRNESERHVDPESLGAALRKALGGSGRVTPVAAGADTRWRVDATLSETVGRDGARDLTCFWLGLELVDGERGTVEAALVKELYLAGHGAVERGTSEGDRFETDLGRAAGLGPRELRAAAAKLSEKLAGLGVPESLAPPGGRAVVRVGRLANESDVHVNTGILRGLVVQTLCESKRFVPAAVPRDAEERRAEPRLALTGKVGNARTRAGDASRETWRIELELHDRRVEEPLFRVESETAVEKKR